MDPTNFDKMSRDELVAKARSLGVERPDLMTRVELGDEIVRRTQTDPVAQQRARGWLGVARDLVASVVGSGLSMPDAAALIRGDRGVLEFKGPSPVATVTLAEIYATQGHTERALNMLQEVLTREPEHPAALALRDRLLADPRARRAEGSSAQSKGDVEPLAWSSPPSEDDDAPRTSENPQGEELPVEFSVGEGRAEAPAEAVRQEPGRDVDGSAVDVDAVAFQPVSLAPPLTDLPTRPDAAALDLSASVAEPLDRAASADAPAALDETAIEAALPVAPQSEPVREAVASEPEPIAAAFDPEPVREAVASELEPIAAAFDPEPVREAVALEPESIAAAFDPEPVREAVALEPEPIAAAFDPEPVVREAVASEPELAAEAEDGNVESAGGPLAPESDIVPTLLPAPMPEPDPEPAVIVLRRAGADPLVCWDLPEGELSEQALELECHAFFATQKGSERRSVTLSVTSRRGSAVLSGFGRATLVRAALGTRTQGTFLPLVIASELRQTDVSLDVSFRPPLSHSLPLTPAERSLIEQFST